jgi:hypothetical protein
VKKDCHLDLWVDCELELALRRLADEDDRKLSAYMRLVLERHVEHCEQQVAPKPAASSRSSMSAEPNRADRIGRIADRVRARMQPTEDE